MVLIALGGNEGQRVALLDEAGVLLRLDCVAEAVVLRFLEGIVLQGDDELLLPEGDFLELVLHLTALALVALLIVDSVVKRENQVVLLLGKAHHGRVGKGHGVVALLVGVVIHHHAVHHPAFLVLVVHTKYVTFDSVVEGT